MKGRERGRTGRAASIASIRFGAALFCALALMAGSPRSSAAALNDTATGVGTVLGNALNPGPERSRAQDPDWATAKHTPTGQLFTLPPAVPEIRKSASGWEYSGQIEFGYLGGDADEENARFRMYQDIDESAYLNNFSLSLRKPEGGYTLDVTGGGAGRHDQYYGVQYGRANAWKVKLFFSETPHVFTHQYKSLWSGIGTGNLQLLPGLTPGGTASTAADNAAVTATAFQNEQSLSLTRKKGGVRFDLDFSNAWKAYASYSLEKRKGARPLGSVWGNNPGTAPLEIPEPIDYDTHDILAGLQYVSGLNALNIRASASFFTNRINTLTFQEPYRIAPAQGVTTVPAAGAYTQGRFDLTPSNEAYNARAEYTRSLPDFHRSYFTIVASGGTWRQDDNLIPYVITPNVSLANVTTQAGGSWDSVTALSRRSANAVIDTRLLDMTFSANPTSALNVKAKGRYYETDNNTDPFLAVNPNAVYTDADAGTAGNQTRGLTLDGITGVWGRPLNDGSGQSVLLGTNATPAGNVQIRSLSYSSKMYRFGPTAEYRMNKNLTFNGALEREITRRTHRDRDRTTEDKAKGGLVLRGVGDVSARLSYEFAQRRGDDYMPSIYGEAFSPVIVGMPSAAGSNVTTWIRANSGFRNYDLADRDQQILNARVDASLRPNLDAGVSLQSRNATFPNSPFGQKRSDQDSANLDLSYQPSPRQTLYGFYSYQVGHARQRALASANANVIIGQSSELGVITANNAVAIGSAPGGPLYPLLNTWAADSTDRNHVFGVGFKQDFGPATLSVDYSYSTGRTRIEYEYNVGGALNAANAVFAGNRMPDLATDTSYIDASLRIPLTQRVAARLVYRYQKETIRDWHYRNLDSTPVALGGQGAGALPTAVVLDGGPDNYKVNWFGVLFQLKL
jgi:hypothetical protein